MYDNYEPQYWWFECFDYVRRLALTGLMVIVLPGSALQGFIGVLIALGGLLSYNTFNPFVEDASDRLAMAAQLVTFFVFLSALMIHTGGSPTAPSTSQGRRRRRTTLFSVLITRRRRGRTASIPGIDGELGPPPTWRTY